MSASSEHGDAEEARSLWAVLDGRLDAEPDLAARVASSLRRVTGRPASARRRVPGLRAAFDPVEAYRQQPDALRDRLEALDIEALKDMVTVYAMDPRKLALRWKSKERLVDFISGVVEQRAGRGDAFSH